MGIMHDALKLLFPRGEAWRRIPQDALVTGLGCNLDKLESGAYAIINESRPGTATDTLPEWHEVLGQHYDPSLLIADQRARLESTRLSIGGMTLLQLQDQLQREFPLVFVFEVTTNSEAGEDECGVAICGAVEGDYHPTYYDITGEVGDEADEIRIRAILEHFAPAHLDPNVLVTIPGITTSSEAGIAICGLEEAGSDGA
jgi:hypothetical protein